MTTTTCPRYVKVCTGTVLLEIYDGRKIPEELRLLIAVSGAEPELVTLTHAEANECCSSWDGVSPTFGMLSLCTDAVGWHLWRLGDDADPVALSVQNAT